MQNNVSSSFSSHRLIIFKKNPDIVNEKAINKQRKPFYY